MQGFRELLISEAESGAPQTPQGYKLLWSGPFQILPYVSHLVVHLYSMIQW